MAKDNPGWKERNARNEPEVAGGWKSQLQRLIDKHAGTRADGRVAAHRTRDQTATVLFAGMNTLHYELGMRIQILTNFNERHITRLVQHWHESGKAVSTMRTDLSVWRKFVAWIGKKGMIKPIEYYLPEVPRADLILSAESEDGKSWTSCRVDVQAKINEAFALNERLGLLLLAQLTFGLRKQEALCLRPWKADHGTGLTVYPDAGPKGGRPRIVPILLPIQRVVLNYIKERVKKTHWLGWQYTRRGAPASLAYNNKEYADRMEELGVTRALTGTSGHGLRAEFSERMAGVKGFCPVTLGGTSDQMPYDELMAKVAEISEMLGHSRTQVMASYFGSFKRPRGEKKFEFVEITASLSTRTVAKTQPEQAGEGAGTGTQEAPLTGCQTIAG